MKLAMLLETKDRPCSTTTRVMHAYLDHSEAVQVVEMVKERLSQDDAKQTGWLLDGYPRSADQAEAIEEAGIRPDVFILIDVSPYTTAADQKSCCLTCICDLHMIVKHCLLCAWHTEPG